MADAVLEALMCLDLTPGSGAEVRSEDMQREESRKMATQFLSGFRKCVKVLKVLGALLATEAAKARTCPPQLTDAVGYRAMLGEVRWLVLSSPPNQHGPALLSIPWVAAEKEHEQARRTSGRAQETVRATTVGRTSRKRRGGQDHLKPARRSWQRDRKGSVRHNEPRAEQ